MQIEERIKPADCARQAMRLLAERRLAPTPTNYRNAWIEVGGTDESGPANTIGTVGVESHSNGAAARSRIDWPEQIGRLVTALDRIDPGWTPARKRTGLRRVLDTSRDEATLVDRIGKLAEAWSRPHGELTDLVAAGAAAEIPPPAAAPTASARAIVADPAIGDELATLAVQFCESLVAVAQTEQWSDSVVDAVKAALVRPIQLEAVAHAREVLRLTHATQSDLAQSRKASNDALRQTLGQWMRWIGDLDETTDRFNNRLQAHASRAGRCDAIDEARRIVQSVVTDAGAMRAEISATRETFVRAKVKAEALQERVDQLESRLAEASSQLVVDELTSTLNRRGLEKEFGRLERDCRLRERPMAIAMIDIDDFKRINDELGHQGGDSALCHVCEVLAAGLGPAGVLARFGGEEFVVMLPGCDIGRAEQQLGELQVELAARHFQFGADTRSIRFSGGLTVCVPGDSLESTLRRADEALYRAKRAGKNCLRRA